MLSLDMTNTHSLIDFPAPGITPGSDKGKQLLYNQAHVVLVVSNTSVTAKIQAAPSTYQVPGEDTPITLTTSWTNGSSAATIQSKLATNGFNAFLSVTNSFLDQRENKTNVVTQIDVKFERAYEIPGRVGHLSDHYVRGGLPHQQREPTEQRPAHQRGGRTLQRRTRLERGHAQSALRVGQLQLPELGRSGRHQHRRNVSLRVDVRRPDDSFTELE